MSLITMLEKTDLTAYAPRELEELEKSMKKMMVELEVEKNRRTLMEKMKLKSSSSSSSDSLKKKIVKNYTVSTSDEEEVGVIKKKTTTVKKTTPVVAPSTPADAEDRYKKWTIPKMISFLEKNKVDASKYLKRDEYIEIIRSNNLVREMHKSVE